PSSDSDAGRERIGCADPAIPAMPETRMSPSATHPIEPARLLIELGLVVVGLASLGRLAHRFGFSTIPLYLVAGLAFGTGGVAPLEVSHEFIRVASEIGVLLLLFLLGLETSAEQLAAQMRATIPAGIADLVLNYAPGFAAGLLLGWGVPVAAI